MAYTREIEIAEQIAREAGELLMTFYRGDYEVELKGGGEPVTEADRASNTHIVARLREAFPEDAILAEESGVSTAPTGDSGRLWLVDPMDGTQEFITHTDEFAVMIGLAVDGRPLLGVVSQPAAQTLYRGVVGDGAERVTANRTEPLAVRDETDLASLRLICSRSHLPDVVSRMMQQLGITELVRSGSVGLKIGRIGTGECDLYLHPSLGTKLWDACAPEAILHAAGGRLTDFDGRPIAYDPADIHNRRGLLASNRVAHDAVLARLTGLY